MKKVFHHHMIIRQEHLNEYGSLFGGRVLSVIDELAFIACTRTYPGLNFVTRAITHAEFTAPARLGDLLEFQFGLEKIGRTSAVVRVRMLVYSGVRKKGGAVSFDGKVVMVCVDDAGLPKPISG
ncbi:MAG: acyl-CoA thioesterase [Lentisphaerota bacterium]